MIRRVIAMAVLVSSLAGLSPSGLRAELCQNWPGTLRSAQGSWQDRQAWEKATLTVEATLQYSRANWGQYPWAVSALQPTWSPGPNLFWRNAYTNQRTEPVDGSAGTPGQIGYSVASREGINVGATVSLYSVGWGLVQIAAGYYKDPLEFSRPTQYLNEVAHESP